jgi:hypothetical protein
VGWRTLTTTSTVLTRSAADLASVTPAFIVGVAEARGGARTSLDENLMSELGKMRRGGRGHGDPGFPGEISFTAPIFISTNSAKKCQVK